MPTRMDDGTFVYPTLRSALYYARNAGFKVEKHDGIFYADREDNPSDYQLVEVPGPYLNYAWKRR